MLFSVWKTAFLNTNKDLVKMVCNIFLPSTLFRHRSYRFVPLQPPVQQCQTYLPSGMTLLVKPKRISPTKTILQPYWHPPTSRRLLWHQWSVRMGEMGLSCCKWKRVRISRWDGWRWIVVHYDQTCQPNSTWHYGQAYTWALPSLLQTLVTTLRMSSRIRYSTN